MIDCGNCTISGTGSTVTQTINFNKTFPSVPKVFLTIQRYSTTNLFGASVTLVSGNTTGCEIAFQATSGLSYTINWLAVC